MIIEMRLNEGPFKRILSGKKTIEYRVNDEKRQKIKIGDKIIFSLRPLEVEKIEVVITDLKYYKNLLEMFTATFDRDFKDRYKSPQEVVDNTPYYTEEDIEKYGCVAIYFEKI